ncbi:hypothetical protein CC80DRAFT_112333 [Byssothecium circinans]|uniref:Uncharacterized protein n=1 Tax=Byssothecium circinans TaxID=147558 RepID=A0A6A5U1L8_9PLEO|nr:hypothetical protein CC80DRAFT_112333 [Byssothecium circinans]
MIVVLCMVSVHAQFLRLARKFALCQAALTAPSDSTDAIKVNLSLPKSYVSVRRKHWSLQKDSVWILCGLTGQSSRLHPLYGQLQRCTDKH